MQGRFNQFSLFYDRILCPKYTNNVENSSSCKDSFFPEKEKRKIAQDCSTNQKILEAPQ